MLCSVVCHFLAAHHPPPQAVTKGSKTKPEVSQFLSTDSPFPHPKSEALSQRREVIYKHLCSDLHTKSEVKLHTPAMSGTKQDKKAEMSFPQRDTLDSSRRINLNFVKIRVGAQSHSIEFPLSLEPSRTEL